MKIAERTVAGVFPGACTFNKLRLLFLVAGAAGCTSTLSIASGTNGSVSAAGTSTGTIGSGTGGSRTATGSNSSTGGSTTGTTTGTTTGAPATCGTLAVCRLSDGGFYCADESNDSANCGGCGVTCFGLTSCAPPGTCVCTDGTVCSDDAGAPICSDVIRDNFNCGGCGVVCDRDYADGSNCDAGACACATPGSHSCANLPSSAEPTCTCAPFSGVCATPSFATDIYPLLAQQSGAFGCAAASCHSGDPPQAGLAFLDDGGQMDAGMAYAELLGTGKGGGGFDVPACDAGVPPFSASTQCACFSRVVPGNPSASLLADLVTDSIPAACANDLQGMPKDPRSGIWLPLPGCSQQLVVQWVEKGAKP